MSLPPSSRARPGPRRRTLLAAAAGIGAVAGAGLLTGCSDDGESAAEARAVSAGRQARTRAAHDSTQLIARYDAVLAAHPDLAGRLRPLRAQVVQHVEAFGGRGHGAATGDASASPSAARAGAAGSGTRTSAEVSADPAKARAVLAGAERDLADRRIAALSGVPGELARLLASVAAAGAAHAFLLSEGEK